MQILDRHRNPRGRSLPNRQRFLRRAKAQVQEAVRDASAKRDIRGADPIANHRHKAQLQCRMEGVSLLFDPGAGRVRAALSAPAGTGYARLRRGPQKGASSQIGALGHRLGVGWTVRGPLPARGGAG